MWDIYTQSNYNSQHTAMTLPCSQVESLARLPYKKRVVAWTEVARNAGEKRVGGVWIAVDKIKTCLAYGSA